MHVWDPTNSHTIFSVNFFDIAASHSVSCLTYSSKYHLYIAVTTDFKLLVFNEHLKYVKQKDEHGVVKPIELKVRLVNHIHFSEKDSKLVTAGVGGCFIFDFTVKTKYDPKQALFLDPDGKNMKIIIGNKHNVNKDLYWLKGLKVDEKEGMIFLWSQEVTCFNQLDTGEIVGKYHSLTSKEDYITDLIISEEFKYFITSTVFGLIYVWKMNVRTTLFHTDNLDELTRYKNMKTKRKLIHSYSGHTKKVTSLAPHPNNTMFISASLDCTVRIWCLDKFIELYCFNLTTGLTDIKLINDKLFACIYFNKIKICKLQHIASSFCSPNSKIK
jgi:WD40 repeat protein